jgi:hypothetical protein
MSLVNRTLARHVGEQRPGKHYAGSHGNTTPLFNQMETAMFKKFILAALVALACCAAPLIGRAEGGYAITRSSGNVAMIRRAPRVSRDLGRSKAMDLRRLPAQDKKMKKDPEMRHPLIRRLDQLRR